MTNLLVPVFGQAWGRGRGHDAEALGPEGSLAVCSPVPAESAGPAGHPEQRAPFASCPSWLKPRR